MHMQEGIRYRKIIMNRRKKVEKRLGVRNIQTGAFKKLDLDQS